VNNLGIHRGDTFEELINLSNMVYERKEIALVQKIATPIKVLKIQGRRITNAYFEQKSTLDFIGTYKGIPIAFDTKETKGNRFPLKNIHDHQIEFMEGWNLNGGRAFILVSFREFDKVYRLELDDLMFHWKAWKQNKGKRGYASIPHSFFENHFKEIKSRNGILLDYLEGLTG